MGFFGAERGEHSSLNDFSLLVEHKHRHGLVGAVKHNALVLVWRLIDGRLVLSAQELYAIGVELLHAREAGERVSRLKVEFLKVSADHALEGVGKVELEFEVVGVVLFGNVASLRAVVVNHFLFWYKSHTYFI